jgi:glycosyltransferase involved in cell wall biosynthesis
MTTYNGEKYIKQQIDSILDQLDNDDELIISDDGSTDSTLDIISLYSDKRIVLLHHSQNKELLKFSHAGFHLIADNFENALKIAKGDYIFLSDQDDVWLKERKTECLKYLLNYDIVLCNFTIIDENNELLCKKCCNKSPISKFLIVNIIKVRFVGCCMAFNRKVLEFVLPFPDKLFLHDLWIGCIGSSLGKFCFIDAVLHGYRRYNNNVSPFKKSDNRLIFKIVYRITILVQILKRIYQIKRKKIYSK